MILYRLDIFNEHIITLYYIIVLILRFKIGKFNTLALRYLNIETVKKTIIQEYIQHRYER